MATVEVPGKTATAAPAILPTRLSIPRITLLSLYWVAIGYLWNSMGAQVLPPLVLRFVGHASQGTALSILESTGTFAAIFVQPVMGSLSDHTNFWWGRRRPYIAGGTIGSATFLVLMAFVGSYFWLFALYFLLQLSENTAQGPYQGLLPDVVPEADRGKASAFVGLGNLVGTLIGSQVIGLFARHNRYDLAVMSMAAVLLFTMALTVTLIPDRVKPAPGLRLNLSEVTIGTFKISPKKHANFMWLIACRLLILMGVVGLQTYVFFFFKDVFYPGPGQKLLGDASGATQYLLGIIVFMARMKRCISSSFLENSGSNTFKAMRLLSLWSVAWNTMPEEPRPMTGPIE